MNTVITSTGMITNEEPGLSANPHECHIFKHQVKFTETDVIEHIEWFITGGCPDGVSIDASTGLISGQLKPLHKQTLCQNNLNPKEPLLADGSNRESNGLYRDATHTFSFTINRRYLIEILDPTPEQLEEANGEIPTEEEIATSDVTLMVIKSGNIGNTIFMANYLEDQTPYEINIITIGFDGQPTLSVTTDRRHIMHNDKKYYKEDLAQLYIDHPGPFSQCPNDEE